MNRINLIQNHRIWLVAVFCLFVNVNMLAVSVGDTFFIDNLKYQIKENNEVAFMGVGRNVIKKEVVIPDAVSYGNVVYPVTSILEGYFGDVEKVVFGKNIKEVGSYAFSFSGKGLVNNCLKTVVFNEKLQKIGEHAFDCCFYMENAAENKNIDEGKKRVIIPDEVSVIGQDAFSDCSSIETFDTGDGLTYLTKQTIYGLKQLILGKNIRKIDGINSRGLVQIKCFCELPPACQSSFSGNIYNNTILYVQKGSRSWYYVGEYWKNFNTIVEKQLTRVPCKVPVVSIIDNKINITCNTKDADIYYSLKAIDNVEEAKYDEPIMPSTKYILTAYAKVDEFDVSETVSFPFTVIQEDPTKIVTIKADNDDASVAVNGKNILISTANGVMQPTIVSTTNGSLVYDGTVSGQSVIPVTQGGIYIVKAGNTTKKVLVK